MTLHVNLFGGPGVGKSTTRAGLFYRLKLAGIRAEEAPEYAKDLTWEGNTHSLRHQAYVSARQWYRQVRCEGQVDVVVTDSPFIIGIVYGGLGMRPEFEHWLMAELREMHTLNVVLERVKVYDPVGRNQSEVEARLLDTALRALLHKHDIPYETVVADGAPAVERVVAMVLARLGRV